MRENPNNIITVSGRLEGELQLSHRVMDESFYTGTLAVKRLSGVVDSLPVTIPGKLLAVSRIERGCPIMITGQLRSHTDMTDRSGRLMVTLFAQNIAETSENDATNQVTLAGRLFKPPTYRVTPFGREICDVMLVVNRAYGKRDLIPCIAWGRNARYASRFCVGDAALLNGRLQYREYQKLMENGEIMIRNVIEVSAFSFEAIETKEVEFYTIHGTGSDINIDALYRDAKRVVRLSS